HDDGVVPDAQRLVERRRTGCRVGKPRSRDSRRSRVDTAEAPATRAAHAVWARRRVLRAGGRRDAAAICRRARGRGWSRRIALAFTTALLTGAAFRVVTSEVAGAPAYSAWVALAAAVVALAWARPGKGDFTPIAGLPWRSRGVVASAFVFLGSLFLVWQRV